jgi:hypothetical protein
LSPDVEIEIEILDEGMSKPTRLDDAILGPWGEKMFGVEAIADVRRDLARVQRRQTEALRRDILEALKCSRAERCSAARMRPRSRSRARRARRAAGVRSGNDPGAEDPPAEPAPALALAPPSCFARCAACGAPLLWVGARLACANRSCPRWGRPA